MRLHYSSTHLVCPPPLISHSPSVESCLCFDYHMSPCTAAHFPTIIYLSEGLQALATQRLVPYFPALLFRFLSLASSNAHITPPASATPSLRLQRSCTAASGQLLSQLCLVRLQCRVCWIERPVQGSAMAETFRVLTEHVQDTEHVSLLPLFTSLSTDASFLLPTQQRALK